MSRHRRCPLRLDVNLLDSWGTTGPPGRVGRREQIERLIKMDTEHLKKKCGFIKKS